MIPALTHNQIRILANSGGNFWCQANKNKTDTEIVSWNIVLNLAYQSHISQESYKGVFEA